MPTSDILAKAVVAAIGVAISVLLVLFRNWINRRRRTNPHFESAYNKVTWAFLIVAGVIATIAILYMYLTLPTVQH